MRIGCVCRCEFCERHQRFLKVAAGRSLRRMRKAIEELEHLLINTELDRDVLQAKLDGTWPQVRREAGE